MARNQLAIRVRSRTGTGVRKSTHRPRESGTSDACSNGSAELTKATGGPGTGRGGVQRGIPSVRSCPESRCAMRVPWRFQSSCPSFSGIRRPSLRASSPGRTMASRGVSPQGGRHGRNGPGLADSLQGLNLVFTASGSDSRPCLPAAAFHWTSHCEALARRDSQG